MLGVYQLSEKSAIQSLTTKLASFESAYREKKKEGTAGTLGRQRLEGAQRL